MCIIDAIESIILAQYGKKKNSTRLLKEIYVKDVQDFFTRSKKQHIIGCVITIRHQDFHEQIAEIFNLRWNEWTKKVLKATLAVNLSYHKTLGASPFIWTNRRSPELDIDKHIYVKRIKKNKRKRKENICKLKWVKKEDIRNTSQIEGRGSKRKEKAKTTYVTRHNIYIYRAIWNKMSGPSQRGFKVHKKIGTESH